MAYFLRNRAAEKLYGYEEYEVLGQRYTELLIDEGHDAAKQFLKFIQESSWSGQFPFKKKSGEIFMALVSKSLLYEDDDLVGIITVSSDGAVLNRINPNPCHLRIDQDCRREQMQKRGLDLKKIKRQAQLQIASVPQIASTVSNLVLFYSNLST